MDFNDLEFDLDSDSQQTNDPNLMFNNFEYDYDLFENRINNYSNIMNNEIIVNDVFLNQNNQSFDPFIEYENNFNNEDIDDRSDVESERESGFEEFLDDFCESTESLANTSLSFGCICCNSCQNKSKIFINKTNQLIQHFKRQIKDFKDNVRQNKVEPKEEDVKSLNNNDLETKIKLPKVKKEKSSKPLTENKKHCKLCNRSFPNLTTRQFADHMYNVCPARVLPETKLVKCDLCSREFIKPSGMSSHKRTKHKKQIETKGIPFVMTDSII